MDSHQLEKIFKRALSCEARFDELSRVIYSCDASIYKVLPLGVIFPQTIEDIVQTICIAQQHGIAIIPRGGATGISGGCLGEGIVLDTSRFLNKILHIDLDQKIAICEPGVLQDQLNQAVSPFGLRLGPDTSTGNRATLGGMVANNAAGSRSLLYGTMADHLHHVKMILASGELHSFGSLSLEDWPHQRSSIYQTCWGLRTELKDEILNRFPPLPRRVSGYNFPHLLTESSLNLCKLIAGSEGTLGVISEVTVSLVPKLHQPILCLIRYGSLQKAFDQVSSILVSLPSALEVIDQHIIHEGKKAPSFPYSLDWLTEDLAALLIVEYQGEEAYEKASRLAQDVGSPAVLIQDPTAMKIVWELRKAGLGLLLSKRSFTRAVAFLEDIAVPPSHLAVFMQEFLQLLSHEDKQAGIYGHAGAGCLHVRPYMNIYSESDQTTMLRLMQSTTTLLLKYQGTWSGEHGDGLVRSWLNEELFGSSIYQGFKRFKEAFDPSYLMNPNKIVQGQPFLQNLRPSPEKSVKTFLNFSKEGGFQLAADLCNGNGLCRKKEGLMCPSFQATNDEKDSTRARANMLKHLLEKGPSSANLADPNLHEVLDLCLACKGCKKECPSQVDMAKFKIEALYHYQQQFGISLRSWIFAKSGMLFSWSAPFAGWTNTFIQSSIGKKIFKFLQISSHLEFPSLAPLSFENWVARQPTLSQTPNILLFNDTFTNFNHPEIGQAAYRLLQKLGYQVHVPKWACCGRTALSKGMLPYAKQLAQHVTQSLEKFSGIPLIVLEPSCLSAWIDDFEDLELKKRSHVYSLEDFLLLPDSLARLRKIFQPKPHSVAIHVHCHQKALLGNLSLYKLLQSFPCLEVHLLNTGCCGVAGSFGYEQEHAQISQKIAQVALLPALQQLAPETQIIANGTSCRQQIQSLGYQSYHLVNYLERVIK